MKRSMLPIVGLVCMLTSGLGELSAASVVVWVVGVGILGYCAGRHVMRGPDD